VRFVTVRAPEPKLGGLNFRESVSIRTDPAVDLATGPRATKGEALHSGLRESSPLSPDCPARLVNNYLKVIILEQRVEHAFGTIKARTGAAVPASPPLRAEVRAGGAITSRECR
jgi:hypothetical protein